MRFDFDDDQGFVVVFFFVFDLDDEEAPPGLLKLLGLVVSVPVVVLPRRDAELPQRVPAARRGRGAVDADASDDAVAAGPHALALRKFPPQSLLSEVRRRRHHRPALYLHAVHRHFGDHPAERRRHEALPPRRQARRLSPRESDPPYAPSRDDPRRVPRPREDRTAQGRPQRIPVEPAPQRRRGLPHFPQRRRGRLRRRRLGRRRLGLQGRLDARPLRRRRRSNETPIELPRSRRPPPATQRRPENRGHPEQTGRRRHPLPPARVGIPPPPDALRALALGKPRPPTPPRGHQIHVRLLRSPRHLHLLA
mmetsp:Transcript_37641/g.120744  ORF Transcript_37641/g.120744 Transcript_37641/m.120744 type:complete len:308 (-) Transcript_37641:455-1378(-)